MKNLFFFRSVKSHYNDMALLIFRVVVSVSLMTHGYSKLIRLIEGNIWGRTHLFFNEEISLALVMQPQILLVDEPSIGLEPRFIDMVFGILDDLQKKDGKTIIMVEQNAKKGLSFADIGYVLVSGETAIAETGDNVLSNPAVGRLFLGG